MSSNPSSVVTVGWFWEGVGWLASCCMDGGTVGSYTSTSLTCRLLVMLSEADFVTALGCFLPTIHLNVSTYTLTRFKHFNVNLWKFLLIYQWFSEFRTEIVAIQIFINSDINPITTE